VNFQQLNRFHRSAAAMLRLIEFSNGFQHWWKIVNECDKKLKFKRDFAEIIDEIFGTLASRATKCTSLLYALLIKLIAVSVSFWMCKITICYEKYATMQQ